MLIMICLLYMMFTMMNMIFLVHLLLGIKFIMIILCLQFMMITMMDVILLLPLLLMKLFMLMCNDTFMHVDHDKNALCDSYIVEFIHDATENYFERGKYGIEIF